MLVLAMADHAHGSKPTINQLIFRSFISRNDDLMRRTREFLQDGIAGDGYQDKSITLGCDGCCFQMYMCKCMMSIGRFYILHQTPPGFMHCNGLSHLSICRLNVGHLDIWQTGNKLSAIQQKKNSGEPGMTIIPND